MVTLKTFRDGINQYLRWFITFVTVHNLWRHLRAHVHSHVENMVVQRTKIK